MTVSSKAKALDEAAVGTAGLAAAAVAGLRGAVASLRGRESGGEHNEQLHKAPPGGDSVRALRGAGERLEYPRRRLPAAHLPADDNTLCVCGLGPRRRPGGRRRSATEAKPDGDYQNLCCVHAGHHVTRRT